MMNPHYNPQQLNIFAQLENTIAEDGYLGLKPGCEENEDRVLQSFPMKERNLLNRNLPCAKQHKLSQLKNWREQRKIEIFNIMSNGSPSLFYAKRRLPCHAPHPLGFLSSNNIPPMKTALSSHASYSSLGIAVWLGQTWPSLLVFSPFHTRRWKISHLSDLF